MLGRKKELSSTLLGSFLGGLQIKLTKGRLTREKKPDLIMYICIGVHKEMSFKKVFRIGGLYTILTDQASNCREITSQRKRGLGLLEGVSYEKVTRKCVVNKGCLARSVMKMSLLFLGRVENIFTNGN